MFIPFIKSALKRAKVDLFFSDLQNVFVVFVCD